MRTTGQMHWFGGSILNYRVDSSPITITLGGTLPSGEVLPPAVLKGLQSSMILAAAPMVPAVVRELNQLRFYVVPFGASSYAVEASTNFANWMPVLTNQTGETFTLPFQNSGSVPVFFRLRKE